MNDFISELSNNKKTEWVKGTKRFLFYGSQKSESIHIIKFAKESSEKLYIEGDLDIEEKRIKEAKFVLLIIDTEKQIILIEKNALVFQSISTGINALEEYFDSKMMNFDYVVKIYPLTSKNQFWNYVENADEIYELSIEVSSPNLFLGHESTREIISEINKATNNDTTIVTFKSKRGNLKIVRELIGDFIDYAREVGGKYILNYKKNGHMRRKTSESDTETAYIEPKKSEKYTNEEMKEIKQKTLEINMLEMRSDEG